MKSVPTDIPLAWFLIFAATCFVIGLFGVLVRRNAIAVLMAIEIMLNAANINLIAFWRYGVGDGHGADGPIAGIVLAVFVITVAAAEVAVGIGLILLCYRRWRASDIDHFDDLAG